MLRNSLHMQQRRTLKLLRLLLLQRSLDLYLTGEVRISLIFQEHFLILTAHIRRHLYLWIFQMRMRIILRQRKLKMLRVSGLRHLQTLMSAHRRDLLKDLMVLSVQVQCLCLMAVSTSSQKLRLWLQSFQCLRASAIQ